MTSVSCPPSPSLLKQTTYSLRRSPARDVAPISPPNQPESVTKNTKIITPPQNYLASGQLDRTFTQMCRLHEPSVSNGLPVEVVGCSYYFTILRYLLAELLSRTGAGVAFKFRSPRILCRRPDGVQSPPCPTEGYHRQTASSSCWPADLRPPPRAVAFNGNFTRKEVISLKMYLS